MDPNALYKISYGMYVVNSIKEGKLNGQIANTVFQVTSEPPAIAVSINKTNLTYEFIRKSRIFTVSILSKETPMNYIGRFGFKSGRDIDKFEGVNYKLGKTGAPVVPEYSVAYLEAEVADIVDIGTHTIFIGRIIDSKKLSDDEPMTYAYYHEIKKGKSPKAAPTYVEENTKEAGVMKKYKCKICGYVYDSEKGDPDGGIQPGTPFEQIPDDWVCPVCGASKEDFEEI